MVLEILFSRRRFSFWGTFFHESLQGPDSKKTVYLSGYCMRSYQSRPPRACYSDGNEENRLARSPVHQISDF